MSASTHLLPEKRLWMNAHAAGATQPLVARAVEGLAADDSSKVRTCFVVAVVAVLLLAAFVTIRKAARAIEAKLLYHPRASDKFADVFVRRNGTTFLKWGVRSYTVPFPLAAAATNGAKTATTSTSKSVKLPCPAGAASDLRYLALVPARHRQCAGTVVLFHGNAGTAEDIMRLFGARLSGMNLAVFAPEYPGYAGDPSGVKPSEDALLAHAVQMLDHITSTGHAATDRPLVLLGHSLGGAVAVHVASRRPALVHAVLLVGPVSSVSAVAAARVPYVPFRWLVHDNFDACAWARLVICPVTVLRGMDDVIVPPHVSAHLAQCFPVRPRLVDLHKGTHNDLFSTHAADVWAAVEHAVVDAAAFRDAIAH
jgi:pimeloyl-ACP methyl ester carboxylesterase